MELAGGRINEKEKQNLGRRKPLLFLSITISKEMVSQVFPWLCIFKLAESCKYLIFLLLTGSKICGCKNQDYAKVAFLLLTTLGSHSACYLQSVLSV